MKTIAAVLALSTAISMNTIAVAEPFNERGQNYVVIVKSEVTADRSQVKVTNQGFNDRGENYIVEAPVSNSGRKPAVSLRDSTVRGWNS